MSLLRVLNGGASLVFAGYLVGAAVIQYSGAAIVIVSLTMLARRWYRGRERV
jgi:hypothetical protein